MKKLKVFKTRLNEEARRQILYTYSEKYFNLWLNSWKWKGINREQREYVMRKLWDVGSVGAFTIINPTKTFLKGKAPADEENGLLGFATFAPQNYNMFNYPTAVKLINERATPYIPSRLMTNNKDVVLIYAQHDRQPLRGIVESYINRIVEVEMVIRTNLCAHKLPFVIKVGEQSMDKAQQLMADIMRDEPSLFVGVNDLSSIDSVQTNAPYLIDKLQAYKVDLENELLTFLGINNIGSLEKKERLITDEANSNNQLIGTYSDSIGSNLKEGCDLINKILGFNVSVEPAINPIEDKEESEEGEGEGDNE